MPFSRIYPCMDFKDLKDPIRHLSKGKVEDPSTVSKIFIEVQVATKRVYRTKSGLLLNHLPGSSPSKAGPINKFLCHGDCFRLTLTIYLPRMSSTVVVMPSLCYLCTSVKATTLLPGLWISLNVEYHRIAKKLQQALLRRSRSSRHPCTYHHRICIWSGWWLWSRAFIKSLW